MRATQKIKLSLLLCPRSKLQICVNTVIALIVLELLLEFHLQRLNNIRKLQNQRKAPLLDWPPEASLNLRDYLSPLIDTAIILPHGLCKNKSFLLIAVQSKIDGFVERQIIRETWGNTINYNYPVFKKMNAHMKGSYYPAPENRLRFYAEYLSGVDDNLTASVTVVFIIGRSKNNEFSMKLSEEADQFNDIIQEDFIDSYTNLTLKSVAAMKYIDNACSNNAAFFFKADTDSFVNVPTLLHFLLGGTVPDYGDVKITAQMTATREVLIGYRHRNGRPFNTIDSKWYMPHYMYPGRYYPDYLSGAGYLMSMDVLQRLYRAAWHTRINYMEDLYVTGLCALTAKVKPLNNSLFHIRKRIISCHTRSTIMQHRLKGWEMIEVFKFLTNNRVKCML